MTNHQPTSPTSRSGRLNTVDRLCYTVSICCIAVSVVLSLMLIWGAYESEYLWKGLLSMSVFFMASLLVLGVNNFVQRGR